MRFFFFTTLMVLSGFVLCFAGNENIIPREPIAKQGSALKILGPIPAACTPTTTAYCCGFGITNFTFHNINNNSANASEGYKDFSGTLAIDTVIAGQSYSVSVSTLTPSSHNVRVWIDYNNDGVFNPTSELVFSADNSLLATGTITISGTATLNTDLRLRVSADHSLQAIPTPCSNPYYGQVEDYGIHIKPNTNPPVAQFAANNTLTCSGVISFLDKSQNVPTSWQWSFGDGSSSTFQNPSHTYTASGTYSVSLTTTNAYGNNALVKANYISVTLGNTPKTPSCMPATFSYCCGYGIYKYQVGTINKTSADGIDGYQDYSCTDQTTLTEGQSYSVTIQTSPTLTQDTKVWIDFNDDGTFNQANELVFTSLNSINPTGNITIPTGAGTYNKLLRMRVSSENSGAGQGPCTSLIKGQVEDYGVTIIQFVGVAEIQDRVNVAVYPNPFKESTTIYIDPSSWKAVQGNALLELYDLHGRVVKEQLIVNNLSTIERGTLNAGIYFYKIKNCNNNIASGKIVIE